MDVAAKQNEAREIVKLVALVVTKVGPRFECIQQFEDVWLDEVDWAFLSLNSNLLLDLSEAFKIMTHAKHFNQSDLEGWSHKGKNDDCQSDNMLTLES